MWKIICFFLLPLAVCAATSNEEFFEQSIYWPLRVSWESSNSVDKGFPGILIRMEDANTALLDYGRDGIHRVSIEQTDLSERIKRLKSGETDKELPNFVAYTTNMFVHYSAPGKTEALTPESMVMFSKYLLIYCNDSTLMEEAVVDELQDLTKRLIETDILPLFVATNFAFYNQLTEVELAPINMMTPHMSVGSIKMLSHEPDLEGAITAALIDPDGKVYQVWRSCLKDNAATLSKIQNTLTSVE